MSYNKTIEITKINTTGNVIQYEIQDNTGLNLLKNQTVEAWVVGHTCYTLSSTCYVVLWGGTGCSIHGQNAF